MPWRRGRKFVCRKKYELAAEMPEWALKAGFPKCTVPADSWFGIGPFVRELGRLKLNYVLEIKSSYNVRIRSEKPKLTPTKRLAKNQYDLTNISEFFRNIIFAVKYGFAHDEETGKHEKTLYHAKIITARLNSVPGRHRIVESTDPVGKTVKYLLTDQLTWEAGRIISVYSYRRVIEEFFRNAKQLSDMEGATVRSEQGVTTALCLVFRIDFLLHFENWKQCIAGELPKEPLTIPSIVRREQYENSKAFIEKVQNDEEFVRKWLGVEKNSIFRKRKMRNNLVELNESESDAGGMDLAA